MPSSMGFAEPDSRIIDEMYDPDKAGNYNLCMLAGYDGFSFALLDIRQNKFIGLEVFYYGKVTGTDNLCSKLSRIFDEDQLLGSSGFNLVEFCFSGNRSTLVPDPLYHESDAVKLLEFNFPHEDGEVIFTDHLKILGAKNIFSVPHKVISLVREKFPKVIIHHQATALIESCLLQNKNREEKIITVHIHLAGFEMVVTRRNELIFYNSFAYESSEDFLYFILFSMEQLQLNPETTPFVFTGSVERSSALYLITCKYIRYVGFAERTDHYDFADSFENIPAHFHHVLFNQHLCGS